MALRHKLVEQLIQRLRTLRKGVLRGPREFRRYLDVSLGSLSELSYTLMLARDLKILESDDWKQLDELQGRAGGMTWLLYKSLVAKKATTLDAG